MRTTIWITAGLLILWVAYAVSPFFAVYGLARAVQERNIAELTERVDFPAVRRSLTAQVVRTYGRITGKTGQPGSIVEQFAVAAGAALADTMVAKLITPEAFIDLLQSGQTADVLSDNAPSLNGLSSDALGSVWRVYANSELGIARFFLDVPVDKPREEKFRLQFCLKDWAWKLCGVELPEALQLRLAQELVKTQSR
jgi:hypothetical protein